METRKVRRKSQGVSALSNLMIYRERVALRCIQAVQWLWHTCLFLNPYALWRSDDFWTKCQLWFCALRSRISVDAEERQRILEWVDSKVTRVRPPTNFTSDWQDGIALCALIEALIPGSCPRFDLLNPENAINNTNMAMKLIERHLGIRTRLTAEDMVNCSKGSDRKIMALTAQLKLASSKAVLKKAITLPIIQGAGETEDTFFNTNQDCFAKGMGLVLAVKGRKATFNIYLKSTLQLNIVIEIRGPGNTLCSQRITSRSPKRKNQIKASVVAAMGFAEPGLKFSSSLEDGEARDPKAVKIPFEYEVLSGKVRVGYIPVVNGKHRLSIIWQGQHIMGSPYIVSVDETEDNQLDLKSKTSNRRIISFKRTNSQDSTKDIVPNLSTSSLQVERPEFPASVVNDFRPRSGSCSSMTSKNLSTSTSRQLGTVTRRRVLRHIVRVDGKDMIIEDSTPEEFATALHSLGRSNSLSLSKLPLNPQYKFENERDRSTEGSDSFERVETETLEQLKRERRRSPRRERATSVPDSLLSSQLGGSPLPSQMYSPDTDCDASHVPNLIKPSSSFDTSTDLSLSMSSGMNNELYNSGNSTLSEPPNSEATYMFGSPSSKTLIGGTNCFDNLKDCPLLLEEVSELESKCEGTGVHDTLVKVETDKNNGVLSICEEETGSLEWLVVSVDEYHNSSVKLTSSPVSENNEEINVAENSKIVSEIIETLVEAEISSGATGNRLFFETLHEEIEADPPCYSPETTTDTSSSITLNPPVPPLSVNSSVKETEVLKPGIVPANTSVFSLSQTPSKPNEVGEIQSQSSFIKMKEFWERSLSIDKSAEFDLSKTQVQECDSPPIAADVNPSVKQKLDFWQTLTGSSDNVKQPAYPSPKPDKCSKDSSSRFSSTKWKRDDSGWRKMQVISAENGQANTGKNKPFTVFEKGTTPIASKHEQRSAFFRLGSPVSEGTEDSGVFVQETSKDSSDSRPRSKSDPNTSPLQLDEEMINFRSRGSLGSPMTLIYKQNPLFSLDSTHESFSIQDGSSAAETSGTDLTDDRGYIDDDIPDYASILMDNYVSFTGLLENDRCMSRRELLGLDFDNQNSSNRTFTFHDSLFQNETSPILPRANMCRVFGSGVYYGQVGLRNQFQVRTDGAGKGCLTVSVQGPGQHDVNEIVISYAGHHEYEIMYDVSEPGYYIISVKWCELNIPESPFICKVTY